MIAKLKKQCMLRLAAKLPPCRDIIRMVSGPPDRKPTVKERVQIRAHFLICDWCPRYEHQLRFLRDAAHRHSCEAGGDVPAFTLPAEARERIKNALQNSQD